MKQKQKKNSWRDYLTDEEIEQVVKVEASKRPSAAMVLLRSKIRNRAYGRRRRARHG